MTTTYSVHVEVGTYVWDVTGNDTDHDLAPAYGLADPLTISNSWPASDFQPIVQPDPAEATLTIIAPDSSTYPLLTVGDPVAIEFYSQGGFTGNGQTFYGRVASLSARPHALGVLYSLSCVDYMADLGEMQVGNVNYPSETLPNRFSRVMAEAFLPNVPAFPTATGNLLTARSASPVPLSEYLVHLCEQWEVNQTVDELGNGPLASGVTGRQSIPVIRPRITARRLDAVPYELEWTTVGRHVAWPPPGRLANVAGLQTITVATTATGTGSQVVDAGSVNFEATFTKLKGPDSVSRYIVTGATRVDGLDTGGFAFTNSWPAEPATTPITATMTVELDDGGLVSMYQRNTFWGRPSPVVDWSLPSLTWLPWNLAVNWVMPKLGDVFTVCRVATSKSPQAREWVNGIVTGFTLTVAGGRPTVDVQLGSLNLYSPGENARQLGASLGVARFDSPILGTTTFAQLSTRDTFNDYALVRGS